MTFSPPGYETKLPLPRKRGLPELIVLKRRSLGTSLWVGTREFVVAIVQNSIMRQSPHSCHDLHDVGIQRTKMEEFAGSF